MSSERGSKPVRWICNWDREDFFKHHDWVKIYDVGRPAAEGGISVEDLEQRGIAGVYKRDNGDG